MGIQLDSIKDPRLRSVIASKIADALGCPDECPGRPSDDPESALHDYILEYAHSRGWLAVHSRMDRPTTTAVGVSDFVLITPKTVYFVEAKRPGRKCTPQQRAFLAAVSVLGWPQAVVHDRAEFDAFISRQE